MKYKKKLISILLCLVMVFPLFQVLVFASAEITKKDGSSITSVFVGETYSLKVAGYHVKFYSNNKNLATVDLSYGTLDALSPGTVKITAKSVETGKLVATKEIEIKQRAKEIGTDSDFIRLNPSEKVNINTILSPENSTDILEYESENNTIAKVDRLSGAVTGCTKGVTNIKIYSKAFWNTPLDDETNITKDIKVYVGIPAVIQARCMSPCKVNIQFDKDVSGENFETSEFEVKNVGGAKIVTVQEVEKSGKNLVLTLGENISNTDSYTVSYCGTSVTINQNNNVIESVSVEPTSVPDNVDTQLYLVTKDEHGNEIEKYELGENGIFATYQVVTSKNSSVSNGKVLLNNTNASLEIKGIYHVFDDQGMEIKTISSGSINITCSNKIDFTKTKYTVVTGNKEIVFDSPDFESVHYTCEEDVNPLLQLAFYNVNGERVLKYDDLKIQSSNNFILELSGDVPIISIYPKRTGTVYLMVKSKSTKMDEISLPIEVKSKRKPSLISFEKSNFYFSQNVQPNESVAIKSFDQYGEPIDDKDYSSALILKPDNAEEENLIINNNIITFPLYKNGGHYQYEIKGRKGSKGLIDVYVQSPVSVDIEWGNMNFNYSHGKWNEVTHKWEDIGWYCDNGSNVVKITNRGMDNIYTTCSYSKVNNEIDAYFKEKENICTLPIQVAKSGGNVEVKTLLNGVPSTTITNENIGNVTVSIGLEKGGIVSVGGCKYYIENGKFKIGIRKNLQDGLWYFFGNDYKSVKASFENDENGNKYYFGDDGSMLKGVVDVAGEKYYFKEDKNGMYPVQYGGKLIDGDYFFFYPETGIMAHGVTIEGNTYGEDGKMIKK